MYEDSPPPCFKEGPCGTDGVCSIPGRRSGHAATTFNFNGGEAVLLLYGGETYQSEASSVRVLTQDIVTGVFEGSSVHWARMNLDCPQPFSCPVPRRDASISIIDGRGGSSGKLVLFGGYAGAPIHDYLEGSGLALVSLNDLWYLDLEQLDADGGGLECLKIGKCLTPLKWVLMDVPGDRPLSRFGAGMSILDSDGQGFLYLSGGIHKTEDASSLPTQELDDLFLFQLRDPFFRRCAATGKGLVSATAGQSTPFYIACTNLLGAPAQGAQFAVSVLPGASCSGCPSAYPPVLSVGMGLYQCSFAPIVAGEYEIHIKVGRGGSKFQESVGGDANAEASVDDASIRAQLNSNRTFFELLVLAAPTNQQASIAQGQGLTLTTSGRQPADGYHPQSRSLLLFAAVSSSADHLCPSFSALSPHPIRRSSLSASVIAAVRPLRDKGVHAVA